MRKTFILLILILIVSRLNAQEHDKILRSIFDEALTDTTAWAQLRYLCKNANGRLAGSPASLRAIEFTRRAMKEAGADTVWLQKVTVPHWVRGKENCKVVSRVMGERELTISTLGLSVATQPGGLNTGVIEIRDFEELKEIGKSRIEGKIVFFNRPADNKLINTFAGYGGAVNQRLSGAAEASRFGARAVIVRSATQALDDFPHTGTTRYPDDVIKIPAVAVSTSDAELLSSWLKKDSSLSLSLVTECRNLPDTISYNVIGEIRGSEKPEEYITAGGHLDSWDITEGAHDDAGGCVQAMEMIRIFKKLGIRPARTVRAVMFMNEEISGTGGRKYAEEAERKGEKHYAALESDRGVMSPRGFGFDVQGERLARLRSFSKYFAPFNIRDFDAGGGGSDIAPLKSLGALQIGYIPDSQRYFSYHHSANDTFDQVNIRELQMGSAAIASMIYLLDQFGY